ncbi:MAG: hypothetical protein JO295_06410 [Verrucomicrobia bacterium]|nr:hypothetical protein [Verrucomicrobiota bacterium]
MSAVGGWLVATCILFVWVCFAARRQPIAITLFDAYALSIYTGVFIFGTWLLVLWPLYVFVPLQFPLWRWPFCTFCGATAGFVIMAVFLRRVPSLSDPSFPLIATAALAGGCTCLFGSLTATRFHYVRPA